jgi:hypothetical protein
LYNTIQQPDGLLTTSRCSNSSVFIDVVVVVVDGVGGGGGVGVVAIKAAVHICAKPDSAQATVSVAAAPKIVPALCISLMPPLLSF